MLALDTLI